jgi:hypothetical protein
MNLVKVILTKDISKEGLRTRNKLKNPTEANLFG